MLGLSKYLKLKPKELEKGATLRHGIPPPLYTLMAPASLAGRYARAKARNLGILALAYTNISQMHPFTGQA